MRAVWVSGRITALIWVNSDGAWFVRELSS